MKVILLGLLCAATLVIGVKAGYHAEIGIPLAASIKAAEDKLFAAGNNGKSARIIGGVVGRIEKYPFLAGLVVKFKVLYIVELTSFCGASLVSANRLVTAAHCVVDDFNIPAVGLEVALGSQFIFHDPRIPAMAAVAHPEYNPRFLNNDIAVIALQQKVKLTKTIKPIRLPLTPSYKKNKFIGQTAVAVGYGRTSYVAERINDMFVILTVSYSYEKEFGKSLDYNSQVRAVSLRVIDEDACRRFRIYSRPGNIICTSGTNGNRRVGPCKGDSGGPLFITQNKTNILIGVTSYTTGYRCDVGKPSGFSSVTRYLTFIKEHL